MNCIYFGIILAFGIVYLIVSLVLIVLTIKKLLSLCRKYNERSKIRVVRNKNTKVERNIKNEKIQSTINENEDDYQKVEKEEIENLIIGNVNNQNVEKEVSEIMDNIEYGFEKVENAEVFQILNDREYAFTNIKEEEIAPVLVDNIDCGCSDEDGSISDMDIIQYNDCNWPVETDQSKESVLYEKSSQYERTDQFTVSLPLNRNYQFKTSNQPKETDKYKKNGQSQRSKSVLCNESPLLEKYNPSEENNEFELFEEFKPSRESMLFSKDDESNESYPFKRILKFEGNDQYNGNVSFDKSYQSDRIDRPLINSKTEENDQSKGSVSYQFERSDYFTERVRPNRSLGRRYSGSGHYFGRNGCFCKRYDFYRRGQFEAHSVSGENNLSATGDYFKQFDYFRDKCEATNQSELFEEIHQWSVSSSENDDPEESCVSAEDNQSEEDYRVKYHQAKENNYDEGNCQSDEYDESHRNDVSQERNLLVRYNHFVENNESGSSNDFDQNVYLNKSHYVDEDHYFHRTNGVYVDNDDLSDLSNYSNRCRCCDNCEYIRKTIYFDESDSSEESD